MIDRKLKQLTRLLDEIEELSSSPRSREESLRLANKLEEITRYRMVEIETNLLEEVTQKDMERINDENAQQILSEYPPGFYRSELRTYKNKKKENNNESTESSRGSM